MEYGDQVVQHHVGPHDARFPVVVASGGVRAPVAVVDLAPADAGNAGEFRQPCAEFRERPETAGIDPYVGSGGQQVSLLEVDGQRAVRRVLPVDVIPSGIGDEACDVAFGRGHEPRIAVGGVDHHLRSGGGLRDLRLQRLVPLRDGGERPFAFLAPVDRLRHGHEPFGLAERRLLQILPDIAERDAQLAQLGFHRAGAVHAEQQHQVGAQRQEPFVVHVAVVAHVADPVGVRGDVSVGDALPARYADDARCGPHGVEHRHVGRGHADDALRPGLDGLSVESRRGRLSVAGDEERRGGPFGGPLPRGPGP